MRGGSGVSMNKVTKILFLLLLTSCLIAVRAFASAIFYDPLIAFFKSGHISEGFPEMNMTKLLFNISLRFWLNTVISLTILWVLFQKSEILKISLVLYGIAFVVLLGVFILLLTVSENQSYMPLFYVRRFLIHPLFVLLLIPAFYFQQIKK